MMGELGLSADALSVAQHYEGLIDAFVVDTVDAAIASKVGFPVDVRPIVMVNETDRDQLARAVLRFADRLARPTGRSKSGGAA
jgi:LPPG:FO 2-phospho-L-lactate transferase